MAKNNKGKFWTRVIAGALAVMMILAGGISLIVALIRG